MRWARAAAALVVSGGRLLRHICAARRKAVAWRDVTVALADERWVPTSIREQRNVRAGSAHGYGCVGTAGGLYLAMRRRRRVSDPVLRGSRRWARPSTPCSAWATTGIPPRSRLRTHGALDPAEACCVARSVRRACRRATLTLRVARCPDRVSPVQRRANSQHSEWHLADGPIEETDPRRATAKACPQVSGRRASEGSNAERRAAA